MKALYCLGCGDILAPFSGEREGVWRHCQCGIAAVRWIDGPRGQLEVTSSEGQAAVRVLGIHNGLLYAARDWPLGASSEQWRNLHDSLTHDAVGYVFHESNRRCVIAAIRPNETPDVHWVAWHDRGTV